VFLYKLVGVESTWTGVTCDQRKSSRTR